MNQPEIIIYSLPDCGLCKTTKEYLKSKNVIFTDVDVQADEPAAARMVEISGQTSTPVIDIAGHVIVGFQKKIIDELLGL